MKQSKFLKSMLSITALILGLVWKLILCTIIVTFYPTALKGCRGIVFTHDVRMGGWAGGRAGVLSGGRVGGRREKVCPGCISETVRCRKLILGRDIG